jgi:hypothetical protein
MKQAEAEIERRVVMSKQGAQKVLTQIAILLTLTFAGETAMSLEQPDYTVAYKDGDVEYRQYDSYLVAETVIENVEDYNDAGNEGFRRLFRYITGSNRNQSKIAMTAPVQQDPVSEKIAMTTPVQQTNAAGGWRVAFMLPTKYSMETAPAPTDPRVRIREVPGRMMAVLRYSGRWTESNFNKRKAALRAALSESDIETVGEMQSAVYNPPYTPPFLRRNEVMIEVMESPQARTSRAAEYLALGAGS